MQNPVARIQISRAKPRRYALRPASTFLSTIDADSFSEARPSCRATSYHLILGAVAHGLLFRYGDSAQQKRNACVTALHGICTEVPTVRRLGDTGYVQNLSIADWPIPARAVACTTVTCRGCRHRAQNRILLQTAGDFLKIYRYEPVF